jgi:hypothetical protein
MICVACRTRRTRRTPGAPWAPRAWLPALVLGAFLAPATAAYGYWTATATAAVTVSTSVVPAPPTAPTNLTCTGSNDPRTLSWTASAGATSYRVYRDTGALLFTVTTTTLQMSEADMGTPQISSQRYGLVVRAANEGGESSSGAALTASFKAGRPC